MPTRSEYRTTQSALHPMQSRENRGSGRERGRNGTGPFESHLEKHWPRTIIAHQPIAVMPALGVRLTPRTTCQPSTLKFCFGRETAGLSIEDAAAALHLGG